MRQKLSKNMKKIFLYTLVFGVVVGAGTVFGQFSDQDFSRGVCDALSPRVWSLVEVASTAEAAPIDATSDAVVIMSNPVTDPTLGLAHASTVCDNISGFSSGDTLNMTVAFFAHGSNTLETRIPKTLYMKTENPDPATRYGKMDRLSTNTCLVVDTASITGTAQSRYFYPIILCDKHAD